MQDLTWNTGELLDSLEKSQQVLKEEKIRLKEKLVLMEEKKEELQKPLIKKLSLRAEQEQWLEKDCRYLQKLWSCHGNSTCSCRQKM